MKIKSIKKNTAKKTVYDISVDEVSRYVLHNGVLTHNSGVQYAASTIVFLGKSKDKDGTEQIGVNVRAVLPKSRLTIENSRVMTNINFKTGLSRYFGLVDIALEAGIITKDGTRIVWTDGTKVYEKSKYKDPTKYFTKEILDKIDAFCHKKFTYQSGDLPVESADDKDALTHDEGE